MKKAPGPRKRKQLPGVLRSPIVLGACPVLRGKAQVRWAYLLAVAQAGCDQYLLWEVKTYLC